MKEIVIAILGSSAFFSFVQYMLTRRDNKKNNAEQIKQLEQKIDENDKKTVERFEEVNLKLDTNQAILARTHILRFADEQRSGTIHHSKEYFEQQLDDIKTYNDYCEAHPKFRNERTVMSSEYIREEYRRLYLNNDTVNR